MGNVNAWKAQLLCNNQTMLGCEHCHHYGKNIAGDTHCYKFPPIRIMLNFCEWRSDEERAKNPAPLPICDGFTSKRKTSI